MYRSIFTKWNAQTKQWKASRPSWLLKRDHLYELEINKPIGLRFLYILFVIENDRIQNPFNSAVLHKLP